MKKIFTVLAIIIFATQYANAGTLGPRSKLHANNGSDDKASALIPTAVSMLMKIPSVNEPITDLINKIMVSIISIDDQTGGSGSLMIETGLSCVEDNLKWTDCWEKKMSPAMCDSISRIIKHYVKDNMMQMMLLAVSNAVLKVC